MTNNVISRIVPSWVLDKWNSTNILISFEWNVCSKLPGVSVDGIDEQPEGGPNRDWIIGGKGKLLAPSWRVMVGGLLVGYVDDESVAGYLDWRPKVANSLSLKAGCDLLSTISAYGTLKFFYVANSI